SGKYENEKFVLCRMLFNWLFLLSNVRSNFRGFPGSRGGAIALAIFGFLVILGFGFSNWCGLWYKTAGHLNKNQSLVGFAPVYVFGTGALFALTVGYLLGG
ncbi:MAG: hypothetical protein ACKPEQ_42825, partial [Dolichospermum sp.]